MRGPDVQLARALAGLARGLRRALQARLARERAADAGELLALQRQQARTLALHDEREFADAWAQTLVYLLLASRWLAPERAPRLAERIATVDPRLAELVARMLALAEVDALRSAIAEVPLAAAAEDAVMHFYEHFLGAYDPRVRAARGVYFTPAAVVDYLVETTDAVLRDRLGLPLGLADASAWSEYAARRGLEIPAGVAPTCPFVQVVDPAAGTGTFVLAVIRRARATMTARWGLDPEAERAAWSVYATRELLPRLRGVERLFAPWAIGVLRLALLLEETGVDGPLRAPVLILGDTLAGPDLLAAPISVVIGNPPYEREAPGTDAGGWIRGPQGPLNDYVTRTRAAGAGAHIKNLYNLYVYFWRWACWQVFERRAQAPGVVAMITGASFLRGPGFAGMRAHMRGVASQIYALDLEGDRRAASDSDNVFAVSVPVAATTVIHDGLSQRPGDVWLRRAAGSRAEKLALCAATRELGGSRVAGDVAWVEDAGALDEFAGWPRLVDLFPWQHSGAQWKRTWPIATEEAVLRRRWQALLAGPARAELLRETRDRKLEGRYPPLRSVGLELSEETAESLAEAARRPPRRADLSEQTARSPAERRDTDLSEQTARSPAERRDADLSEQTARSPAAAVPPLRAYGFRALDRRVCLADARLGDFLRPILWSIHGPRQLYLTSLLTGALGPGPAAMVCAEVPDLHHFCGRGGKDVIPLWRDPWAEQPNIGAGALATLRVVLRDLRPSHLLAHVYALLSAPGYTTRFAAGLRAGGPRLPLTRDPVRFAETTALGHALIALHTRGARWLADGPAPPQPRGAARCVRAPDRLPTAAVHADDSLQLLCGDERVGVFAPVSRAVWDHALSGYRPVQAWVAARLSGGTGRKSSRLDAIQPERWEPAVSEALLELLWIVEATLALGPALDAALDAACAGPCWRADELPAPAPAERREPAPSDRSLGPSARRAGP